jgi:hypothetical protein
METLRYQKKVHYTWKSEDPILNISYIGESLIVIDHVFSKEECQQLTLLDWTEGKNEVIFEDLSNELFRRIKNVIPQIIFETDPDLSLKHYEWNFQEISPYWKCYQKQIGSRFGHHYDKMFIKSVDEKSMFSLLFYLNENDGYLKIEDRKIKPKPGRVLLFPIHLLHQAVENSDSVKWFFRSKLIYQRKVQSENEQDREAIQLYQKALEYEQINIEEYDRIIEEACTKSKMFEKHILNLLYT